MKLTLTNDQQLACNNFENFLYNNENIFILCGSAGTGKSFLTKYFADKCNTSSICGIAPTHKAKHILSSMLNKKRMIEIPVFTIASILCKMKDHSYIGTKLYTTANETKLSKFNIFFLDEVSMVSDKDLSFIIDYTKRNNKKIVIIGDPYQIPCPSQQLVLKDDMYVKKNSLAFDYDNINMLNEIVRQSKDSQIINIATFIKDNINIDCDIPYSSIDINEFLELFKKEYISSNVRCICYTNINVTEYNLKIRKSLDYKNNYNVKELLTAYNTLGFPVPIIENGIDYIIVSSKDIENKINGIKCYGKLIKLRVLETYNETPELFFIDVNKEENNEILEELINLAKNVNKPHSSKEDYKKYKVLKDKIIFTENIYIFNNKIMTWNVFKTTHPLLLTKTIDLISYSNNSYNIINNDLSIKINDLYEDLLQTRIVDLQTKHISDSELLCDKFMVIEKDIDYGYALTCHKSQGSTYDTVFVDISDFNKIQNFYNYKLKKYENRTVEKNQLKYVACTRPKKNLYIIL